jgi:asparagine synthase (glutamine-hydrolysing)
VEHFRALLGDAVRDRLRFPRVAILMSGGLDSTSLAATVRRVAPETEIVAYTTVVSAVMPDEEGRFAGAVARRLGIRHEIVDDVPVPMEHLADRELRLPEPLDEPAHAAWRRLATRIAGETPVAFMGDDADALFQPSGLLTMLRTWPPLDVLARVARYTVRHRHHPHLGLWLRRRLRELVKPRAPAVPAWVRRDLVARAGIPRPSVIAPHPTRPDAQRFLLGSICQRVLETCEPACTGAPIEVRYPFLDTRVLEFALAIPPVPWCQKKELMRVAFRDELPEEVLGRPKTPLGAFDEAQVARWRARRSPITLALAPRTAEFVDTARILDYLKSGSTEQVLAAWRVLALDRWLRDL